MEKERKEGREGGERMIDGEREKRRKRSLFFHYRFGHLKRHKHSFVVVFLSHAH